MRQLHLMDFFSQSIHIFVLYENCASFLMEKYSHPMTCMMIFINIYFADNSCNVHSNSTQFIQFNSINHTKLKQALNYFRNDMKN